MSNLRRLNLQLKEGTEGLPPATVTALNGIFKQIEKWAEESNGLRSTVLIARQKERTPSPGKPKKKDLSIDLQGGRIGGGDDPLDLTDHVTLGYLNKRLECSKLLNILANCQEFEDVAGSATPGQDGADGTDGSVTCNQITLSDKRFTATGMTNVFSTQKAQEFAYAFGLDGADPMLKVYRIQYNGDFIFVGSLVLSQELRRTCMQGQFIYGANDGAGSDTLVIIDVTRPNTPAEVGTLNVTDAINGLHVQGKYCYLATEADIKIVNVADSTAPVLV